MNRLVFPLAVAVLAICQPAYAVENARHSNRLFLTGIPHGLLTATQKDDQATPPAPPTQESIKPPSEESPSVYHRYPFGERCGNNASLCCDNAWADYRRGCCGDRLQAKCGGCGICAQCRTRCGHHAGHCGGPRGIAGGFGGCLGGSFAGGCGACGGCGGCGSAIAGCRLHLVRSCGCGGLLRGYHLLSAFRGVGCGCDDKCGCADKGSNDGQATPVAPSDSDPNAESVPSNLPVPEKSAFRPLFPRGTGIFSTSW